MGGESFEGITKGTGSCSHRLIVGSHTRAAAVALAVEVAAGAAWARVAVQEAAKAEAPAVDVEAVPAVGVEAAPAVAVAAGKVAAPDVVADEEVAGEPVRMGSVFVRVVARPELTSVACRVIR
jgi:hypothetical protein